MNSQRCTWSGLKPLPATPERRRWPSWLMAQGHVPELEGTLDPGEGTFSELQKNENSSGSALETKCRKYQLPCKGTLQVLKA